MQNKVIYVVVIVAAFALFVIPAYHLTHDNAMEFPDPSQMDTRPATPVKKSTPSQGQARVPGEVEYYLPKESRGTDSIPRAASRPSAPQWTISETPPPPSTNGLTPESQPSPASGATRRVPSGMEQYQGLADANAGVIDQAAIYLNSHGGSDLEKNALIERGAEKYLGRSVSPSETQMIRDYLHR